MNDLVFSTAYPVRLCLVRPRTKSRSSENHDGIVGRVLLEEKIMFCKEDSNVMKISILEQFNILNEQIKDIPHSISENKIARFKI